MGILIFSDPADDGFAKGDVYPEWPISPRFSHPARQRSVPLAGPRRPVDAVWSLDQGRKAASVRRTEWIHAQAVYPQTLPSGGAPNVDRRFVNRRMGKTNRPQAQRVLRDNPVAAARLRFRPGDPEAPRRPQCPAGWQGGLPLAYHVGPGPAEVSMTVHMTTS